MAKAKLETAREVNETLDNREKFTRQQLDEAQEELRILKMTSQNKISKATQTFEPSKEDSLMLTRSLVRMETMSEGMKEMADRLKAVGSKVGENLTSPPKGTGYIPRGIETTRVEKTDTAATPRHPSKLAAGTTLIVDKRIAQDNRQKNGLRPLEQKPSPVRKERKKPELAQLSYSGIKHESPCTTVSTKPKIAQNEGVHIQTLLLNWAGVNTELLTVLQMPLFPGESRSQ